MFLLPGVAGPMNREDAKAGIDFFEEAVDLF
jgi:hypothetical protein